MRSSSLSLLALATLTAAFSAIFSIPAAVASGPGSLSGQENASSDLENGGDDHLVAMLSYSSEGSSKTVTVYADGRAVLKKIRQASSCRSSEDCRVKISTGAEQRARIPSSVLPLFLRDLARLQREALVRSAGGMDGIEPRRRLEIGLSSDPQGVLISGDLTQVVDPSFEAEAGWKEISQLVQSAAHLADEE